MASTRIAAIDIGSNAPKLFIAEKGKDGKPKIVESVRANLSLGVDTYNNQVISEESITELCDILKRFKKKLLEYKVKDFRVVATSAVREAKNRDFVLERIRQRTGFDCEVLSNSEERHLHNIGLSESFPDFEVLAKDKAIVVDMGAGSVQVTSYKAGERQISHNLKLGYLRMTELFAEIQARSSNYDQVMNDYIGAQLNTLNIYGLDFTENANLIALGNDLQYLYKFSDIATPNNNFFSNLDIQKIYDLLLRTSPLELTLHYDVPSDVADNLLTIVMILNNFLTPYEIDGLYLPEVELSYGLLLDIAASAYKYKIMHDHTKDLVAATDVMALQFGGSLEHLKAKERDAYAIYKVLSKKFNLSEDFEMLLRMSAKLSEVGKFIIPDDYLLTSAGIIRQNEFIGLSGRAAEIIADTITFSVGNEIPDDAHLNYRSYNYRLQVLQQAAILRVVNALEYSGENKITAITTTLNKDTLLIEVEVNRDITLEHWMLMQSSKLIEELFGLKLVLKEK